MTRLVTSIALLIAIGGSAAIAQTGSGGTSTVVKNQPSVTGRDAPIGHRQPRVGDVPPEKNLDDPNDPLSRENRALDKKIKSICRGC
jgi:hypothetical protein